MERFKNICPERKKNFHSGILLKFLKRLDGWNDLKTSCPERKKNFHSDMVLKFFLENFKGLAQMERLSKKAARELGLNLRPWGQTHLR